MRIRDSGMPEEEYWETLFNVPLILSRFRIAQYGDVAEFGCGYGTFSIPVAKSIRGMLHTFDIDDAMTARTRKRGIGLPIVCEKRDVLESGFGVQADAVLLFNILHCEDPMTLLRHAMDAGKRVLIIHWRHSQTPRGPDLSIRPRPEQVIEWASMVGLEQDGDILDLPPWHYGLQFQVPSTTHAD